MTAMLATSAARVPTTSKPTSTVASRSRLASFDATTPTMTTTRRTTMTNGTTSVGVLRQAQTRRSTVDDDADADGARRSSAPIVRFSKGAHFFPVEAADSPDGCSEAASTSSADSSCGGGVDSTMTTTRSPSSDVHDIEMRLQRRSTRPELVDPRRWSTMSVTSSGTMLPADAASCDCTSLALAALRSSSAAARKRRRLLLARRADAAAAAVTDAVAATPLDAAAAITRVDRPSTPSDAYRKLDSTSRSANRSTDSGIGSSSSSSSDGGDGASLVVAGAKPPLALRKRRRSALGLFFDNVVRRVFDSRRIDKPLSAADLHVVAAAHVDLVSCARLFASC